MKPTFFKFLPIALVFSLVLAGCTQIIPMIAPKMEHEPNISAAFPYESRFVEVQNSLMHYVDEGAKDAPIVVLLHGNPTSSYLWRNIIPELSKTHRVVVPDLIGMGKSDKPDLEYTLQDHQKYFTDFVAALGLKNISLVLHDWGGGIGAHYARTHQDNVKDIMMIEAVLRPMDWSEADMIGRYLFKKFRDPKDGYKLIVEQHYFVEKLLPMMAGRDMTEEEMDVYREPYIDQADRKPIHQWPNEIPISGTPERNVVSIQANYDYLKSSNIPLHFIHAEPGLIYNANVVEGLKGDIPRAEFTNVGEGLHFLQESKPRQLSLIIHQWLNR